MTAIFKSATQAIWMAYLLEGLPVKRASGLQMAIDEALKALGQAEPRQASTVNFGGLSDLEVRGQAAMIRYAVEAMISKPQSWAIRARYGMTVIRYEAGQRTMSFGGDRQICIRELAKHLAPGYDTMPTDAVKLLIARLCASEDCMQPSFRQIEQATKTSKSALERAEKRLKKQVFSLIRIGIDELSPFFERDGVIPAREEAVSA